jgi:hypothetical protein
VIRERARTPSQTYSEIETAGRSAMQVSRVKEGWRRRIRM